MQRVSRVLLAMLLLAICSQAAGQTFIQDWLNRFMNPTPAPVDAAVDQAPEGLTPAQQRHEEHKREREARRHPNNQVNNDVDAAVGVDGDVTPAAPAVPPVPAAQAPQMQEPPPAAAADPTTGRGTAGRTTGEPGTGDHGQGMKGLGGATVQVLCSPQQITLGQPFTVNVAYTTDVKRPVDIHVDVLNAHTKAFYAGTTIPMETMKGQVSATIKMSDYAEEPFLWKVFVAPRGEPFPNMLAETGFVAHLGPNVVGNCQPFANTGSDVPNPPKLDSVILASVPKTVALGTTFPVKLSYSLVSAPAATITASLMRKGPNTLVSEAAPVGVTKGSGDLAMPIAVGQDVNEPVYVVVTMTPNGKGWEDRLAEDRTYNVAVARRLRS